ncbi:hypothetical protein BDV09DRAFT_149252 [Aspergillus tetrazonus]
MEQVQSKLHSTSSFRVHRSSVPWPKYGRSAAHPRLTDAHTVQSTITFFESSVSHGGGVSIFLFAVALLQTLPELGWSYLLRASAQ